MNHLWASLAVFLFAMTHSDISRAKYLPEPYTELVMPEGSELIVNTEIGTLTITAGHGLERRYEWNNCWLDANMFPRKGSRWFGSLGAYDAAPSFPLSALFEKSCNGIFRTVVQEGQIHFFDRDSAELWIDRQPTSLTSVWTNDGLVLTWGLNPGRKQLSVELMQLCIRGSKPTALNSANDRAFSWRISGTQTNPRIECANPPRSEIAETWKSLLDYWCEWHQDFLAVDPRCRGRD